MNALPLYVNGRFLTKNPSGTWRFAHETVRALDALLCDGKIHGEIVIVAPPNSVAPQGLSCIKFEIYGNHQGHFWEQWDLYRRTKDGILFSPINSGPLLHAKQIVIVHDAMVYRYPRTYGFAYRTWHQILGCALSRRSVIGTVSDFSRRELASVWGLDADKIFVAHNGCEHIERLVADENIIERLDLRTRPYFLFVGSPAPNKNLARAVQAFAKLGRKDIAFVLVGAANARVFADAELTSADNVLMPGRLTDEEIVALYKNALALVFPSLYEGFGIPPLEAMALGCPVLAARIAPVEEVCGDAALYFSPTDPSEIANCMRKVLDSVELRQLLVAKDGKRYPLFSWKQSAAAIWGEVINICS